jgi:hypothetical protein
LIKLTALPLLLSCGGENFSESWQLDRIRILGARGIVDGATDPILGTRAEARPGDVLSFEALTYAPEDDPIGGLVWMACLPDDEHSDACEGNSKIPDKDDDLEESGIIGIEPFFAPTWTVPDTALDGLDASARTEGLNVFVNLIAYPEAQMKALEETSDKEEKDIDTELLEIAYKRQPISEAEAPNHNPDIIDFVVSGTPIEGSRGFTARQGKIYIIEPILAPGHIETYTYTKRDGTTEYRKEEPFFNWYTENGAAKKDDRALLDQPSTLYPYSSVEWTAPKSPGQVTLHVVVRDRRGGMGWRALSVNVL